MRVDVTLHILPDDTLGEIVPLRLGVTSQDSVEAIVTGDVVEKQVVVGSLVNRSASDTGSTIVAITLIG